MISIKRNVEEFNSNVVDNNGYLYTTNAPLSSILSNKRISDAIIELIPENIKTIVDVGCGDGTYTIDIAIRKPNAKVSGFDPAKEAIVLAKKQNPQLFFYEGNILDNTTLKAEKFDIAVIRGVLHHLSEPELAIKNSGLFADKIIIVEPNGNNPILKIIEKTSSYHLKHEEQSFSSNTLKNWCAKNNFDVKHLDYIGFIPFFFPTILTKIIYFFQPYLEKIYFIKKFFGAQIIIYAEKKTNA